MKRISEVEVSIDETEGFNYDGLIEETNDNQVKNDNVPSNYELFKEYLKSRNLTINDVINFLHAGNVHKFDEYFENGDIVVKTLNVFKNSKQYHSADSGKRSPEEFERDCIVGNIQEYLLIIDSDNKIKENECSTKSNDDINTNSDFKYRDMNVEFKVNYSKKVYGNKIYYNHRDGNIVEKINAGYVYIVYYPYLHCCAIFDKHYFSENYDLNSRKPVYCADTYINNFGKKTNKVIISYNSNIIYHYDCMSKLSDNILYGLNKIHKCIENDIHNAELQNKS